MSPATVELTGRARAVVERAGQPGAEEFYALESVVGHSLADEFEDDGTPQHVLEVFVHAIEERAAASGYRALEERITDEDNSFYDAAHNLSIEYLLDD